MVVIGYGVAALVVIILLIVFNVRAISRRSRPEPERPGDSEQRPAAAEAPSSEPARSADVRPARPDTEDQNYRNALRRLKTGQADPKPAPAADKTSSDSEYREAMRHLRNSKGKKK